MPTPSDSSATLSRPLPPEPLREHALADELGEFAPGLAMWDWTRAAFIDESAPLCNPDHAHLRHARVGILWTNVDNRRHGRRILGTAEMPMARGGKWAKGRHDLQLRDWFGSMPDFLITLSAPYAAAVDPTSLCALVEHELYHCAQARSDYGVPRFSRSTGRPVFAMRGHDVEEFVGVVRRYGSAATGVSELVRAANEGPSIDIASIASVCGTCLRLV